jgi:hypothetical protein
MRKFCLFLILFNLFNCLSAQQRDENVQRPLNSINLNLLGDASIISINYDRMHVISPTFLLSTKIGMGYNEEFQLCIFGPCPAPYSYFTLPHHVTANFGRKKHFFEIGLGATVVSGITDVPYSVYPLAGYRFMPLNSGNLNFRLYGLVPIREPDDYLVSPIGLSVGMSF